MPEAPGVYPGAPQPGAPTPELLQGNALRSGGRPAIDPAAGLGRPSLPAGEPTIPNARPTVTESTHPSELGRMAARPTAHLGGSPPSAGTTVASEPGATLGRRGSQIELGQRRPNVQTAEDAVVSQSQWPPQTRLQPTVTENPVVGDLSRAMQKSGVPIADRPSLLLKGSGRVNRILGPNEDLTEAMAKSVRLAKRQRITKARD